MADIAPKAGPDFVQRYLRELFGQARAQFGQTYDLLVDTIMETVNKAHRDGKDIDIDEIDEAIADIAKSYLLRAGFSHKTLPVRILQAMARRKAKGLLTLSESWISTAYKLGKLSSVDMAAVGLREAFSLGLPAVTLGRQEAAAVRSLEQTAAQYLQPIVEGAGQDAVGALLQQDRQVTMDATLASLKGDVHPLFDGEPHPHRLKGFLGDRAEHWMRNWERVARTEMAYAHDYGHLRRLIETHPINRDKAPDEMVIPPELVFKIPHIYACVHCKRLWLMPDGNTPRLFRLAELIGHGHNFGRKAKDWKATVGPIHPNCLCGPVAVFVPGATLSQYPGMREQLGRFPEVQGDWE